MTSTEISIHDRLRVLLDRLPEPAVGTVIVDSDGAAWQRLDAGWYCAAPGWETPWTWVDLIAEFGIVHTFELSADISHWAVYDGEACDERANPEGSEKAAR